MGLRIIAAFRVNSIMWPPDEGSGLQFVTIDTVFASHRRMWSTCSADLSAMNSDRRDTRFLTGLSGIMWPTRKRSTAGSENLRNEGAHYRVYAFSRRRRIPEGFTTKDMAEDVARAMDALGIRRAHILGVSIHRLFWNSWMVCIQNFRKRNPQKSDEKDKSEFVGRCL